MKILLLTLWLLTFSISASLAGTIEEAGIAGLKCEVWRVDPGAGAIEDRIRCSFSTYDAEGSTVRRSVSTTLEYLTATEIGEIQGCIATAFDSIYGREGFPVPTPRPTPGPTPEAP